MLIPQCWQLLLHIFSILLCQSHNEEITNMILLHHQVRFYNYFDFVFLWLCMVAHRIDMALPWGIWKISIKPPHRGSNTNFRLGSQIFFLNAPTQRSLSNPKTYCTDVKLLILKKGTTRCILLSWLFTRLWVTKHPFFYKSWYINLSSGREDKI